jgi:hypothetical protein
MTTMIKIVGQMVCGGGEADRYLEESFKEFARLCDDVIICFCNATEKEKALARKYDFRFYDDNREWGKYQPGIKTGLLKRILKLGADWILPLDSDETLPTISSQELRVLTEGRESCYFYVVNLWNDPQHYSRAMSFWNVRLYRADESKGTQFLRKPVHCGNAPPYFYNQSAKSAYVPHILLHKGLMKPDDRDRKYRRYQDYDPNAIHKGRDYYDALLFQGVKAEYDQQEVLTKIQDYVRKIQH